MTIMKPMSLKVECSVKISPLLHPYFYNINIFYLFTSLITQECRGYVTVSVGLTFVWDVFEKLIPIKWRVFINVSTPGNVAETLLVITFVELLFFRNYHNMKYINFMDVLRTLSNIQDGAFLQI